ncbi:hypothetical protein F383_30488 [Gossypium arboreum]|uniref:Uncharacterized protein n=1 Tax=Gossypium arboreum TaxID=29729 RepID=A0A0B0PIP6_GOSAR|nr:hypothetical protein F383_30488 [Gossypium arboreum]
MSGTCVGHIIRANVRPCLGHGIDVSQCKTCLGHASATG